MDFLEKLVIPLPGGTLELLKYFLTLAIILFSVYSAILLGSSLVSVFLRLFYSNNEREKRLSADFINLITTHWLLGLFLGLVPLKAIILIYIQLLHGSGLNIHNYLALTYIFYFVGNILLYSYKSLIKRNTGSTTVIGIFGVVAIAISQIILLASIIITTDSAHWKNAALIYSIFSPEVILRIIHGLTLVLALTGISFLVKNFIWDKDKKEDEYSSFSMRFNLWLAMVCGFAQPVFFLLNLMTTPDFTLTQPSFAYILLTLILIFFLLHFLYYSIKENKLRGIMWSFYIIVIVFSLMVIKDQSTFDISSKEQILALETNYGKIEAERLAKSSKTQPKIDGKEIYQVKCTACHKFDVKFVGPPHKEVLSKYADKKEDMIKFIMNPVKVNPDYPPMPPQGLSQKEAEAVAEYMFKEWGEKLK